MRVVLGTAGQRVWWVHGRFASGGGGAWGYLTLWLTLALGRHAVVKTRAHRPQTLIIMVITPIEDEQGGCPDASGCLHPQHKVGGRQPPQQPPHNALEPGFNGALYEFTNLSQPSSRSRHSHAPSLGRTHSRARAALPCRVKSARERCHAHSQHTKERFNSCNVDSLQPWRSAVAGQQHLRRAGPPPALHGAAGGAARPAAC